MIRTLVSVLALALSAVLLGAEVADAQCAMCVTALEQNGGELAAGFNRGILFLLGMPYFVFAAVGAFWLGKQRRRRTSVPAPSE